MKRLTALLVALVISAWAFAQDNVLKFLGIPVDGDRQEFINALKNKGFTYDPYDGYLDGRFNGMDVIVAVLENNGKVHRVAVADTYKCEAGQVIIAYNRLMSQFENNGKYVADEDNEALPETENLAYEMSVHNKQYQAAFYLKGNPQGLVWFAIEEESGEYYLIIFYDNLDNHSHGEDL